MKANAKITRCIFLNKLANAGIIVQFKWNTIVYDLMHIVQKLKFLLWIYPVSLKILFLKL